MTFVRQSIPSSLVAILFEGFLSRLSFGIISFVLPLYAYRRLGLSLTETGLLFSFNLFAEQLFKPVMGWVADRIGLKRSFTCAVGLRSLVALLLIFAAVPWQVFAIRFLHGFSESLRDPAVNALIAEHSSAQSLGSSFAWYSTAKMVAGSVGKAFGGLMLAWSGDNYAQAFLLAFALSSLPLYVVARYLREPARHNAEEMTVPDRRPEALIKTPPKLLFSAATLGFLLATTAHLVHHLFPVLATEYGGLTVGQTSLIYGMSVLFLIFSGPLFGWLTDRFSQRLVLMTRGAANGLSSILYWFFPSFTGFAAGSVADALGKAAFRPAWGSLMAQLSSGDRRRRAQTMSYLSLGEGLGETIGPIIGALLWHAWGIPVLMAVRLLLAIITEIYAIRILRPAGAAKFKPVEGQRQMIR
jgi:MFS family permease